MIKKLKYIAFAIVAVALSSCSSTEEPNAVSSTEDYICFTDPTVNLNATLSDFADKSNTRAVSSWTSINQFQVWGFCVPNDVSGNQNTNAVSQVWNEKSTFFTSDDCGDVFHAMPVATTSGNDYCSYNINDYENPTGNKFQTWNANERAYYAFIGAYVPTGLGSFTMEPGLQTTSVDDNGKNKSHGPRLAFTISKNSMDTTKILYPMNQPDALLAAKFDHRKANGRVNLSFMHFMTGVRFKFHNSTSDKVLKIKRVTYRGFFHKTATFDFTTDDPVMSVSGEYGGKFELFNGSQSISAGTADYMAARINQETGVIDPVTLLLLPNPDGTTEEDENFTLGRHKEIRITYSFVKDGIESSEKTFIYGKNFTLNYIPKPNTLHTAHFYFIGDEFVVMFQADDNNWENGSDNNVIIN